MPSFLTDLSAGPKDTKQNGHEVAATHMVSSVPLTPYVYTSNIICYLRALEIVSWILDSGTSDHMTFDANASLDLKSLHNPPLVSLPNRHNPYKYSYTLSYF